MQTTYIKHFTDQEKAFDWMRMKNRTSERAGNKDTIYCLVEGPDDNHSVVDLRTAIDLGGGYEWSF